MKKHTIPQLLNLLAMPVLTVVLGLILLFSPDTASALVGKLLAWAGILAGAAFCAGAFLGDRTQRNNRIVWAVICFAAGLWILLNPLYLAKFLGRVLGLFLMIRGAQSIRLELRYHNGRVVLTPGLVIAAVTALFGVVLVVLPMTTSRLVFTVVGVVMICVGIAQGCDRLKGRKLLDEGDDPNIIDVEKL